MGLPLFAELKRRRVFRALVAWGIVSFAVLQIIEPVMHGFHWPDAVLSYVVVVLALGFPVVVALAWAFDVNEGHVERKPSGDLRGLRLGSALLLVGLAAATPGAIYYLAVRKPAPDASVPTSVAVLPFVNMSSDKETDYFSDGITEELINALANVAGLRVSSRTAVFALKGKSLGVRQIGEELNVGAFLEGSIRREGTALRVTAQLIQVSDGSHVWSKTYDRELTSIFAVEDEIARSIAASLQKTLVGVKPATTDLEAHDLYLRGRFFWNKRSGESLRKAAGYFEEAIRHDPNYALAWDGLADALALRFEYDNGSGVAVLSRARSAAERALALDPSMGEAHASLGIIAYQERDWSAGFTEFSKAIELSPNYALAYKWAGNAQTLTGHLHEARALIEHALLLDPTSLSANDNMGEISFFERDYAAAAAYFRKTLELDPGFDYSREHLVRALSLGGRHAEALAELIRLQANPSPALTALRATVLARAGRNEEARALAKEVAAGAAGEPDGPGAPSPAMWIALGDTEAAFRSLERLCSRHQLPDTLKVSPEFDPVRSDPRFAAMLRCAKLG